MTIAATSVTSAVDSAILAEYNVILIIDIVTLAVVSVTLAMGIE